MFNWLKNKIVQYILWGVLVLDLILLIIAGFTQEQITGVIAAVVGVVGGVSALILLVIKIINGKDAKNK